MLLNHFEIILTTITILGTISSLAILFFSGIKIKRWYADCYKRKLLSTDPTLFEYDCANNAARARLEAIVADYSEVKSAITKLNDELVFYVKGSPDYNEREATLNTLRARYIRLTAKTEQAYIDARTASSNLTSYIKARRYHL